MVKLLIAILATWRLSAMLSYEAGPFDMFIWFREKIGIYHDDSGEKISNDGSFLAELFDCVWCLSVWIGLAIAVMLYSNPVLWWLLSPFALSAGAIIVEGFTHG